MKTACEIPLKVRSRSRPLQASPSRAEWSRMIGALATGKGWGTRNGSYQEANPRGRRTDFGRLLRDRHVLPPFNYGHSSARRRTQLVQRSMTAIFPSSWRSPAARVKLLSRSICSALSSMRSAAMFSSTRATRLCRESGRCPRPARAARPERSVPVLRPPPRQWP